MADFPVTKATGMEPAENSFPRKKKGESFNEAMNAPNTPSMEEFKHKASVNLIADYCDEDEDSNVARTKW